MYHTLSSLSTSNSTRSDNSFGFNRTYTHAHTYTTFSPTLTSKFVQLLPIPAHVRLPQQYVNNRWKASGA